MPIYYITAYLWFTIVTFGDPYFEPWNRTNTLVIHETREECEAYIQKFEQWERPIIEFLNLDRSLMTFEVSACLPYLQIEQYPTEPQDGEVQNWPVVR